MLALRCGNDLDCNEQGKTRQRKKPFSSKRSMLRGSENTYENVLNYRRVVGSVKGTQVANFQCRQNERHN